MSQSKWESVKESVSDTLISYVISITVQPIVYTAHGIYVSLAQNLTLGASFVAIGLGRRYVVRRWYNRRET